MALFAYQRRVQRLLRDTKTQVINPRDLVDYINEARVLLCGAAECLRVMGSLTLTIGSNGPYPFSGIAIPNAATLGIAGVLSVREAWYQVASGQKRITPRGFEWFGLYELNTPVPVSGPPRTMAQFGQGVLGSLYFSPVPDLAYVVPLDCTAYPAPLALDTDPEAIPALWTYAVPYYATYLAMLSMETGGATAEADKMLKRFNDYVALARGSANSSTLPFQNPQSPDVASMEAFGQPQGGGK